jgi:hypothetical protein
MQAAKADGTQDPRRSHELATAFSDLHRGVGCLLHDALGALVEGAPILK